MSPSSRWSLGHIYTPHRPPLHPPLPPPRLFHLPHKAQSQVLHAFPSLILYFHMIFLFSQGESGICKCSHFILSLLFNWLCIRVFCCVCVSQSSTVTFFYLHINSRSRKANTLHFFTANIKQNTDLRFSATVRFYVPSESIQTLDGYTLPRIWDGKCMNKKCFKQ